jgi:shikimate dehydrogenase
MNKIDSYAVLGFPVKHSKSPRIHQLFAEQTQQQLKYQAIEVPPEQFDDFVTRFFADGGKGLNCTLPLKELAWAYADSKTERAELAKAVNTLVIQANGTILGDNTDGCGLARDLTLNHAITLVNAKLLVLGAGGATRGILAPIIDYKPETLVVANRTVEKAYRLAEDFKSIGAITPAGFNDLAGKSFDLIINATSASLTDELPVLPDAILAAGGNCYDLAYSNQPTAFVRWGKAQEACNSLDGLGMLVEQAAEAFYVWRGIRPETKGVIDLLNAERGMGTS